MSAPAGAYMQLQASGREPTWNFDNIGEADPNAPAVQLVHDNSTVEMMVDEAPVMVPRPPVKVEAPRKDQKFLHVDINSYNIRKTPEFNINKRDNIETQAAKGKPYLVSSVTSMRNGKAVEIVLPQGKRWIYVPRERAKDFRICSSENCLDENINLVSDINNQINGDIQLIGECNTGIATALQIDLPRDHNDLPKPAPAPRPPVLVQSNPSKAGMWDRYQEFARDFSNRHRGINRGNAGKMKRVYLSELINKFGQEQASYMLEAITAWGEAPNRGVSPPYSQKADLAVVMKVIENRTANRFPGVAPDLLDIGIPQSKQNDRLRVMLARWQFSVFNDGDPNLPRMLGFNPDARGNGKDKLRLAFEVSEEMSNGKIQFLGGMNGRNVQHYHANYVHPAWARSSRRIQDPTVRFQLDNGRTVDINVNQNGRDKHYFYGGL